MALQTYRTKRDFKTTSEPRGEKSKSPTGNSYVIQKHDARRLHYDLRLEMDGVLLSWAVTRGPSLVAGEKRLAVHVEDHPLAYGDFEGTIPKGQYGGGTVIVWDRGTWEPIGDAHKAYAKGHMEFALHGEKLKGRWHLVRMHGKPRDKHENWLFIKADDEMAKSEDAPDILEERPESVKTGRVVEEVAQGLSKPRRAIVKAVPKAKSKTSVTPRSKKSAALLPTFVEPELATLVRKAPIGKGWLHEVKFDGYRVQVCITQDEVTLFTRTGLDWTARFGKEIVDDFKSLSADSALIDGELVVETENGASNFSSLQAALSEGKTDLFVYYAFDLLYLNGKDLRGSPLHARQQTLAKLLDQTGEKVRLSVTFDLDGDVMLAHACKLGLEGIVSKRSDAPYRSGRTKDWLKSKCSQRQEFVVAGYVPSSVSRKAIGSLVMGVYENGKLRHAGRVGTGYSASVAEGLFSQLGKMTIAKSPFGYPLSAEARRHVRFVAPELVAEVEFRGWTADHSIRHAAFLGLRDDKKPESIVRESQTADALPHTPQSSVKLTHPDRLYWPQDGVTKEGLAAYYGEVWRFMEPFIVKRPLSLVRCPGGIGEECFFQKHAWQGLSKAIKQTPDPQSKGGKPLISIVDFDGLIGLVQAGVLEIHPWGSSFASLERPDLITMDLDPGEGVAYEAVIAAALEVRERLLIVGLTPFVKTSGGKGLHVVAPLKPKADWTAVKAFTKALAEAMTADSPQKFLATVTKSKRKGKILVDYLRNGRGATAVAPYSTRSRPGAPISMPLSWDELSPAVGPAHFTTQNGPSRLAALKSDPWAEFRAAAVPLPK